MILEIIPGIVNNVRSGMELVIAGQLYLAEKKSLKIAGLTCDSLRPTTNWSSNRQENIDNA